MRIGLDTYSYHLAFSSRKRQTRLDLFGFMDRVAEHGCAGLNIDPRHLVADDEEFLETLREEAGARNLFIELGAEPLSARSLERLVRRGAVLGARVVTTFIGADRHSRSESLQDQLARAAEVVRGVLPALARHKGKIAIENHGDLRSGELVDLVNRIGSADVGLCYDPVGCLPVLEDPIGALERMTPFLFTARLRDCTAVPLETGCHFGGAPVGSGILPLQELYSVLDEQAELDHLILKVTMETTHGAKRSVGAEAEAVSASVAFCTTVLGAGEL